jgi:YidC/Oxa1 family membrane protein insertase
MLKLYREHHFNPFSSVLLLFIQIPILIALYQVFLGVANGANFDLLYSGIRNPGTLNPHFLGMIDLTKTAPFLVLAAGVAQFFQTRMVTPKIPSQNPASFQAAFSRQMLWMGPIITIAVLWNLPAVIALFWLLTSLISIGQQYWVEKYAKNERGSN